MSETPRPPASPASQNPGVAGSCTSRLPLLKRMRSVVMTDSRTLMPPSFAMAALHWREGQSQHQQCCSANTHCIMLPGTHVLRKTRTVTCQGWSGVPHVETSNSSRPKEDMAHTQEAASMVQSRQQTCTQSS